MPSSSFSYSWSSGKETAGVGAGAADPNESTTSLRERLRATATDRVATAEEIVLETSRIAVDWVLERTRGWTWEEAGRELEVELAEWSDEQAWRGPCALWLDSLRRAWHQREERTDAIGFFTEELGLWAWGREPGLEDDPEFAAAWDGEPLGPGRRLPSRLALAARAAEEIERGETVLVGACSETIALALEAAQRNGRRPAVWIAEGLPDLGGRRMARRLARKGLKVHVGYDAALLDALPRADRVWLPTEAIGADAFLGRMGTRVLIEEAERLAVPVALVATSDKLVPGGELRLPAWCARDTWLLWDQAPEGVALESQAYESVALDLVGRLLTENGAESAAALHLRSLRIEPAARCAAREQDPEQDPQQDSVLWPARSGAAQRDRVAAARTDAPAEA